MMKPSFGCLNHPDFGRLGLTTIGYSRLMLNFYPWGLSVNLVIPEAVDRARIVYHGFVGILAC